MKNLRISKDWKLTILKIFGSLILSLVVFMDKTGLTQDRIQETLTIWSYTFIAVFGITSMLYHNEKVILKMSEGISLLQSISFIYWINEMYREEILNHYIIVFIVSSFSILSIYNSFSYKKLSPNNKLALSLWSSMIMIVFSIETFFSIIKNENHKISEIPFLITTYLEYFILGVSLVYLLKNAQLLSRYFPDKSEGYKKFKKRIGKVNQIQINRYSDNQLKRKDTLFALIVLPLIYFSNYQYELFEPRLLIWGLFIIFPIINDIKNSTMTKKQ